MTLLIGLGIIIFFLIMFYIEDKMGIGIYDPKSSHPRDKDSL